MLKSSVQLRELQNRFHIICNYVNHCFLKTLTRAAFKVLFVRTFYYSVSNVPRISRFALLIWPFPVLFCSSTSCLCLFFPSKNPTSKKQPTKDRQRKVKSGTDRQMQHKRTKKKIWENRQRQEVALKPRNMRRKTYKIKQEMSKPVIQSKYSLSIRENTWQHRNKPELIKHHLLIYILQFFMVSMWT